ncbi:MULTISPECIES: hypothetical protein [unclassified Streptomyces]|uniref:hypothetical protein n=1 Tax=unclassified Streptomyces TaxID=2593676 RepID=UPI002E2C4093|nr:hypothetical protein [Streptomyces sp. NBC_00285]
MTSMTAGTPEKIWEQLGDIKRWIDQQSPVDEATALTMRVMKIGEEYGEACEALLAPGPQNKPELVKELCDVILTAAVALYTADDKARKQLLAALSRFDGFSEVPISKLMLKIGQDFGAACQALIGVRAYNPRKGASHTLEDLVACLCDVIRSSMIALDDVEPEPERTLAANLERVHDRSLGVTRLPTEAPHS